MSTALWIVQGLLALVFVGAGAMKLMKSHDDLKADPHMAWANDFSGGFIKFLGSAEVSGGLGMVLPGLTGIAPNLTAWAAAGLAVIMLGATAVHLRRSEMPMVLPSLILALLAGFVSYGRGMNAGLG